MSAAIKMIHVAKRELAMNDDDYRALLGRVSNGATTSLKAMSDRDHQNVIAELKRLGFSPSLSPHRKLNGPFAAKLVALWLSAWNLGITRNRHENALVAFVERQTGISHLRWVREQRDAHRAIDGLKLWIAREAGVEWPTVADGNGRGHKVAVIAAQHRLLGSDHAFIDDCGKTTAQLDQLIAALGEQIRAAKNG